jgi:hypothetical protein
MTTELPDDLVVADGGIQVRHVRPERGRRTAVVDRVEMPIDVVAGLRESQSFIAQEVVPSGEDLVGARACRGCRARPADVDRVR